MYFSSNWVNVKGSSNRSCKCGSWKNHWLNFSGERWPVYCSVKNCNYSATLGGHIRNVNSRKEYIVPMCPSCNNSDKIFELDSSTTLVNANTEETCNR